METLTFNYIVEAQRFKFYKHQPLQTKACKNYIFLF